jgi:ABC-type glycerol-3-phosphate transport system substrate-binding protein
MRRKLLLFVCVLFSLIAVVPVVGAQGSEIIVTLALHDFMRNMSFEDVFAEFEAQNPGVRIQPVYLPFDAFFLDSSAHNIDDHLDGVQALASAADVLLVGENSLSVAGTRAGYFLDLMPLASSDVGLDPAAFIPGAWDAYHWDNGLWALPAKVEPFMFVYDIAAFDRAGLSYPNANWTLGDLANAARTLTQYDDAGAISIPGLVTNGGDALLLHSLVANSLLDEIGSPRFNTPALTALVEAWAALRKEGIVAPSTAQNGLDSSVPMSIVGTFGLTPNPLETDVSPRGVSALPGGRISLDTTGIAVSAGTAHPDIAYALATFLTESAFAQSIPFGYRSALVTPPVAVPAPPTDGVFVFAGSLNLDPALAAAVESLLPQALSGAERRFDDYLSEAVQAVVDGEDAATALSNAEGEAAVHLQTAAARRGVTPLIVATPVPEIALNPGEIDLRFGAGFIAQTNEWEAIMRAFTELDPQVGRVTLDTDFGVFEDYAERTDCFYLNYNAVPEASLGAILPLDPFISIDPAFSPGNVAGNAQSQLQRDSRTWAYPFVINPMLLNYHPGLFAQAGVPEPSDTWSISAFTDALRALNAILPEDQLPYTDRGFGDTYLLLLMAAYGGLPIDYRTTPPTFEFTDPTTVEAIRQVLDLAKADLISYQELAGNTFMIASTDDGTPDPIYSEAVGAGMSFFGGDISTEPIPYRMTAYPTGALNAVSYAIGTGYISAQSQNPDACYRLFGFLAQHPELFDGMPAFRSQFSNPTLLADQGDNAVDFYTRFDALMQDPTNVVIPSSFSGGGVATGTNLSRRWLNQAFDAYVLEDADLLTALTDAESKVNAFQTCLNGLPPFDAANPTANQRGLIDCAVSVDPDMAVLFPSA